MAMVHRGQIIALGSPEAFRTSTDPRVADFINGHAPEHEDVETLLQS